MNTILLEALGINRYGGTRISILNLISNVAAVDQETRYLIMLSSEEPDLKRFPNVEQIVVPTANRFLARLDLQRQLPGLVRRERVTLVHFTKNLGIFGLSCPYIVTMHDLTSFLMKNSLADVVYYRLVEPITLRGAAKVVAVSHDAARDIERTYGILQQNIEVVYWAADDRFGPVIDPERIESVRRRYELPRRYILFIGRLAKKKNLPTLLRALAQLYARMPDAPSLVVVGPPYPQSSDTESASLVQTLALSDRIHFIGGVPDEDVPALYGGAELYVLPSLHEGFGIPLLEAMACGTPVITARGGSLPEVAGDAALIVDDPLDVAGFSSAIERVLSDSTLRQGLIRRGYARAAEFSWARTTHNMLAIYDSVLRKVAK